MGEKQCVRAGGEGRFIVEGSRRCVVVMVQVKQKQPPEPWRLRDFECAVVLPEAIRDLGLPKSALCDECVAPLCVC